MPDAVLAVSDIHTYYGESHVLHGVSLDVAPGEVVAILGRNGMGKTTLIRSVVGFSAPRRGRVRFKGADVTGWAPHRYAQLGIIHAPEGRSVFASLTVEENLELTFRRSRGRSGVRPALEDAYRLFPRLGDRRRQTAARSRAASSACCRSRASWWNGRDC